MPDDYFDGNTDASPLQGDEIIPCISDPSGTPVDGRFTPADLADYLDIGWNNCVITPSISTDNLVVALKTLAGTDPTSANPIVYRIGDTRRTITAALSVTVPAGGDAFAAGGADLLGNAVGLFVYLRYNATDGVCIGVSRIPHARLYSDFADNGNDETMTDEKGAIWNDITTAGASDECQNIGYFEAANAGAAGYEWSGVANIISYPVYESLPLTWTPQHTRSGGAYTNAPSVGLASYRVKYNEVFYDEVHTQNATPGSSGIQQFTAPFAAATKSGGDASNATALTAFVVFQEASSKTVSILKYDATQEATASQEYRVFGRFRL